MINTKTEFKLKLFACMENISFVNEVAEMKRFAHDRLNGGLRKSIKRFLKG